MSVLPTQFVETIVKKIITYNPLLSNDEVLKSLIEDNIIARATFCVDATTTRDEYRCRSIGEYIINVDKDADGDKIHKNIRRYIKANINIDCPVGKYPSIDAGGHLCTDNFEIEDGYNCGLAELEGHVFYINCDIDTNN